MPPPGIEPGFHRPQRCVITPILRWLAYISWDISMLYIVVLGLIPVTCLIC